MNYNSVTVRGHDYTKPLRDVLPAVIGKRSKSISQIAKAAGRQEQTVRNLIERLRAKNQPIYIKRWTRGATGPYIPCYMWGEGKDAERPAPMSNAERSKRYRQTENGKAVCKAVRERWKKSQGGKDYTVSYNKARWAREKFSKGGLAAIDPLLAAVMGRRNQPEKEL